MRESDLNPIYLVTGLGLLLRQARVSKVVNRLTKKTANREKSFDNIEIR